MMKGAGLFRGVQPADRGAYLAWRSSPLANGAGAGGLRAVQIGVYPGRQGKDFAYSDGSGWHAEGGGKTRPWMGCPTGKCASPASPGAMKPSAICGTKGIQAALLLGSDKLPELEHGWLHVEQIAREFGFVCLTRGRDECGA